MKRPEEVLAELEVDAGLSADRRRRPSPRSSSEPRSTGRRAARSRRRSRRRRSRRRRRRRRSRRRGAARPRAPRRRGPRRPRASSRFRRRRSRGRARAAGRAPSRSGRIASRAERAANEEDAARARADQLVRALEQPRADPDLDSWRSRRPGPRPRSAPARRRAASSPGLTARADRARRATPVRPRPVPDGAAAAARLSTPSSRSCSGRTRGGRLRHQVGSGRRLRKRDDVAQRRRARGDRADAVEPQGDAAVRRRAVPERVEEESEALAPLLGRDPEHAEDALLEVVAVDADRARAELPPVDDDVVRARANAARDRSPGVRCPPRGAR